MIEIGAALSGIKALYDAARLAIDARDDAKLKSAMMEMQGKILEAMESALNSKTQAMTIQDALHAAQDELKQIKGKAADRDRYTLTLMPGDGKQYAYASQPHQDGKHYPPHYLCQGCFDKGLKFVLQGSEFYGGTNYDCPGCKTRLCT